MEYLVDINTFFRYLAKQNPGIKRAAFVTTDILEKLEESDWDNYMSWLGTYKFNEKDENERIIRISGCDSIEITCG